METEKPKVEQLKEDKNVRRELEQATGSKPKRKPTVEVKQKFWLGTYVVILLSVGVLYYLVRFGLFDFLGDYARLLERFTIGALAIVLLLVVLKAVKIYLI